MLYSTANFGDPRLPARFWDKVSPEPMSGCWIWVAGCDRDGYAVYHHEGRQHRAHRLAFSALVREVPPSLVADHVVARGCMGAGCVNPGHLEPIAPSLNTSNARISPRGYAGKIASGERRGATMRALTHCPSGHPYDEENTHLRKSGSRSCRACNRDAMRARRAGRAS